MPKKSIIIATLGTEAQVVTTALRLLLEMGEQIEVVTVLHTDAPGKIREALLRLKRADQHEGFPRHVQINLVPIKAGQGKTIRDVSNGEEIAAAFRSVYTELRNAKSKEKKVHFLIAGGRKPLAMFSMLTAQLLFDDDDRMWHLHSGDSFLKSKRLFPEADDEVALIQTPIIRWTPVAPSLRDLVEIDDPYTALARLEELQLADLFHRAEQFVTNVLKDKESVLVEAFVREALSNNQLAERLMVSHRTVEDYLRGVYTKAELHWGLEQVGRVQLMQLLSYYYANVLEEKEESQ